MTQQTDYGELFDRIYATKRGGYGSGGGSDEANCWPYMRLVERLLRQFRPRTVLDLGCGDGRVAGGIFWDGAKYIGVDVCQEALDLHAHHHPHSHLLRLDVLHANLPDADLVLSKEATQHMDIASAKLFVSRLKTYPLALHTSAIMDGEANGDIEPGETRTVDLSLPPFSLPVTTLLEWRCGQDGRYMSQLWEHK